MNAEFRIVLRGRSCLLVSMKFLPDSPGLAKWRILDVVEECHESEIHVKLLMTMKESHAGIVRDEIEGNFLIAAKHDYIFRHACGGLAHDASQFESVAMQVDGVQVVALIAHVDAVALALVQMECRWRHRTS